uniref:Uncharacterized protein n=1 Tax=Aegilops tauschii subsp. strangulata TaxID=200361 RepID=A0A453DIM0_AEGTS
TFLIFFSPPLRSHFSAHFTFRTCVHVFYPPQDCLRCSLLQATMAGFICLGGGHGRIQPVHGWIHLLGRRGFFCAMGELLAASTGTAAAVVGGDCGKFIHIFVFFLLEPVLIFAGTIFRFCCNRGG